jgi:hypothetical protein
VLKTGRFRRIFDFIFQARPFVFNTLLASFRKKYLFCQNPLPAGPIPGPKNKLSSVAKKLQKQASAVGRLEARSEAAANRAQAPGEGHGKTEKRLAEIFMGKTLYY